MVNRCHRFFQHSNCPQNLITAMEVVVASARAVVEAVAVTAAAAVVIAAVAALVAAIIALAEVIAAAAAAAAEAALIASAAAAVLALLVIVRDNLAPVARHPPERQTVLVMTSQSRPFDAFAARPRPAPERIVRSESGIDGERVQAGLAKKTISDISVHDVNNVFEGNLWSLTPEAFLYYLPALMDVALNKYGSVSVLSSELIGALTEPKRADIVASPTDSSRSHPGSH